MKQKRHVAWSSTDELKDVYNWIYSTDDVKIKRAVDIIEIWKCRLAQNKIPRAVLCTASLAKARLTNDSQALGMAVMRFVAIASGEEQDRNRYDYALPLHSVAQKVGIPDWMIKIRHDIAHGMFPSLALLESASLTALEWLKRSFWTEQMEAYELMTTHCNLIPNLEDAMQSYFKICFECVKNNETYQNTSNQLRPILNKVEKHLHDTESGTLMKLLTKPGYIIPTSEQCIALGLPSSPNNALSPSLDDIPNVIADMWFPLFLLFKRLNVLEKMIETSVTSLNLHEIESHCPRQNMLICWCQAWMKACVRNENGRLKNAVSEKVRYTLNWPKLFSHVVKDNLCVELMALSDRIIDLHLPEFAPRQKQIIKNANKLLLVGENSTETRGPYSVETDSSEAGDDGYVEDDQSVVDWSNYPLGTCPNYRGNCWSALILESNI